MTQVGNLAVLFFTPLQQTTGKIVPAPDQNELNERRHPNARISLTSGCLNTILLRPHTTPNNNDKSDRHEKRG